jgi:hypothetical protein
MRATIEAVSDRLTDERGFVYRYLSDDGLDGEEGTFAICTFWLAHCWALLGDMQRAREVFDRLAACSNDVGLLAEEIAPHSTRLLGNFPNPSPASASSTPPERSIEPRGTPTLTRYERHRAGASANALELLRG